MKATTKKAKASPSKAKPTASTKKVASKKTTLARPVVKKVVTKKSVKKLDTPKKVVSKSVGKSVKPKEPIKKEITKKVVPKKVATSSLAKKGVAPAKSPSKNVKGYEKKKQENIAQPPVSVAQSARNEKESDVSHSSHNRSVGKVARAVVPSGLLTIKDNKKTVTERALISQNFKNAPDILENDEGADPGFMQNDEVFDETDYAQHLQLMEQADVSRRARELNRPQVHPDFDGMHCVECDIEIPKLRLDAGRVRCVECQQEIETESKRLYNLERGRG